MVAFFLCIINVLNVFIYYDIIAGLDLSLYHSFLTTFCQKNNNTRFFPENSHFSQF